MLSRLERAIALACFLTLPIACRDDTDLLTASSPTPVSDFVVSDGKGTILWRLVSERPSVLTEVRYGKVPSGFRQVVPADGARPRPFAKGEELSIKTVTDERTFTHEGTATGSIGFRGGYMRSVPFRTPTQGS
jgi:hypothetical protein